MGGTHLPRQLVNHIGFGPEWTHWARRGHFCFLGVRRADFGEFQNSCSQFNITAGPKILLHDFWHPSGSNWLWKKSWRILRPKTQYWALSIFAGGPCLTPLVGLFGQIFYAIINYIYSKVGWARDLNAPFQSHTLARLAQFGPKR